MVFGDQKHYYEKLYAILERAQLAMAKILPSLICSYPKSSNELKLLQNATEMHHISPRCLKLMFFMYQLLLYTDIRSRTTWTWRCIDIRPTATSTKPIRTIYSVTSRIESKG